MQERSSVCFVNRVLEGNGEMIDELKTELTAAGIGQNGFTWECTSHANTISGNRLALGWAADAEL